MTLGTALSSNGCFYVTETIMAKSEPDEGMLTQKTYCFSPSILAGQKLNSLLTPVSVTSITSKKITHNFFHIIIRDSLGI